jgi:hypothetical protein
VERHIAGGALLHCFGMEILCDLGFKLFIGKGTQDE